MEAVNRETPTVRRTRGALADLSRQLAGVTVGMTLLNTPNGNIQMPSSLMSPAPSPDEMIIRLRGRKKTPITWSPASENGVKKLAQYDTTPPKGKPNSEWFFILHLSIFLIEFVYFICRVHSYQHQSDVGTEEQSSQTSPAHRHQGNGYQYISRQVEKSKL